MKVFFDANVYVSDALWGGAASKALDATLEARWKIHVTDELIDEVREVLHRLGKSGPGFVGSYVADMRRQADLIDVPTSRHRVAGDPEDEHVLVGAMAGGADYLVTRDKHLLSLGRVESLRVITLAEYLDVLRSHGVAVE